MIVLTRLVTILALALPNFAAAELFRNLYTSSAPAKVVEPKRKPTGASSVCIAAILQAEQRYDIPDNLLLGIGIQEAGKNSRDGLTVWPWTVNANGEGAFFNSRQDAQAWVRQKQNDGISSIDVGCMQVNLRWHGENFDTLNDAFDPAQNADYAARFLTALFRETGNWRTAAGRYHSATEKHQKRYLDSLSHNQLVVRRELPRLMALARNVGDIQIAQAQVPKAPPPPVFWNSAQNGATYSIYSNTPLQPVLPAFMDKP